MTSFYIYAIASVNIIEDWIEKNGWKGYDPFDIKGHPLFVKLCKPFFLPTRKLINIILVLFPKFLRKLFKIEKEINSKTIGLLFTSYCNLFLVTTSKKYL